MKTKKFLAAVLSMSMLGGGASSAEYGVGAILDSSNEILFPIEISEGRLILQPNITHYNSKDSTGDSAFTGYYLNALVRVNSYRQLDVYAGVNFGAANGRSIYRVFDVSNGTVQTYQRKYRETLVMPNVQVVYRVAENFGVGGQFGIGQWNTDYSLDAYNPTPTSIPMMTSTALKTELFVKYMFR